MIRCVFITLLLLYSRAYGSVSKDTLAVNVLSKFHPQTVRVETRTRQFLLNPNRSKPFSLAAAPDELITITVNESESRSYHGAVNIFWQGGECIIINQSPLEAYVAGVVIGELGSDAAPELIRAQAIMARTYALHRRARGP